ncbi:hypothetical protein [Streptomyces sp. NK08204]|uniref:hypothetical protein n=1 Tax=Streptomyces sp. NK08204 TaxID=2873260 RepID=UPI001CED4E72|nr:hypothetical protein [Streptomyces sp. NK08204]
MRDHGRPPRRTGHPGSRLGHTLVRLAGRADLTGRARTRAADLLDKTGAMAVQVRMSAAAAVHGVLHRRHH